MSLLDQIFPVEGAQGSVKWLHERCGCATASQFWRIIKVLKSGKPSAEGEAYLWEVVIERLTGAPTEHYTTAAMERGTELEPDARMAYEAASGNLVEATGFLKHPDIPHCGASPDGLVAADGCIEIKCQFNSAYHLQCFLTGMPADHMAQVQGVMWIAGRKWCDFISYDPRMPEALQLYVQRIERDDAYIADMDAKVRQFLADVEERLAAIRARAKG